MPNQNDELHVENTKNVFKERHEFSLDSLDLYKMDNAVVLEERTMERFLGKKRSYSVDKEEIYTDTDFSFEGKIKEYTAVTKAKAEDYIHTIHENGLTSSHCARKRVKYAKKATSFYKKCDEKATKLKQIREQLNASNDQDKLALKKKEYDAAISLLDSRLEAMINAARVKSLDENDEKIRILRAKVAIMSCKSKLTDVTITELRELNEDNPVAAKLVDKLNSYNVKQESYINNLNKLIAKKFPANEIEQHEVHRLPLFKDRMIKERDELFEKIPFSDYSYIYTRLVADKDMQIKLGVKNDSARAMRNNFEKHAFLHCGVKNGDMNTISKFMLMDHALNPQLREKIKEIQKEKQEIIEKIEAMDNKQVINVLCELHERDVVPNFLAPAINVLILRSGKGGHEAFGKRWNEDEFIKYCVKPLLQRVTYTSAIDAIKNYEKIPDKEFKENDAFELYEQLAIEVKGQYFVNKWDINFAMRSAEGEAINQYALNNGLHKDRDFWDIGESGNNKCLSQPLQGYKIHIAINNRKDYLKDLHVLIPEFKRLGVDFKIYNGVVMFENTENDIDILRKLGLNDKNIDEELHTKNTVAKEITIYPTYALDLSKLSDEARQILEADSDYYAPSENIRLGHMSARYGGYNSFKVFNKQGKETNDDRKNIDYSYVPPMSNMKDILNYIPSLKQDYLNHDPRYENNPELFVQDYCLGYKADIKMVDVISFEKESDANKMFTKVANDAFHLPCTRVNLFGKFLLVVPKNRMNELTDLRDPDEASRELPIGEHLNNVTINNGPW